MGYAGFFAQCSSLENARRCIPTRQTPIIKTVYNDIHFFQFEKTAVHPTQQKSRDNTNTMTQFHLSSSPKKLKRFVLTTAWYRTAFSIFFGCYILQIIAIQNLIIVHSETSYYATSQNSPVSMATVKVGNFPDKCSASFVKLVC